MRRNNMDISAELLYVAKDGAKKTHLVYKTNLNFMLIKKYLARLTENGLLKSVNEIFFTTFLHFGVNRYDPFFGNSLS